MGSTAPAGDPFEALGDPNRRAILELLSDQGRSVQQLADALPISRPAVSRHLRLLKEAGLVVEEPQGTRRIYRLEDHGVEAVEAYLLQVWGDAVARFRLTAENTAPRPPDGTERAMIEPLRLSYEIDCPADHAFEVWTTRLSTWWPKGHSTSGDPDTHVVLEPRLGGRIFERTPDGREIEWGEITRWNPPSRLGYLWHIGRDRTAATDVDLTFVDLGDGRTRLEIVHTGWERIGADGPAYREANTSGWDALMPHYLAATA